MAHVYDMDCKLGCRLLKAERDKLKEVREWAFNMECMYEDCTYLSHEAFDKDARSHLNKLIELVGKWVPPELRARESNEPITKIA